jgi:hypothetical protein
MILVREEKGYKWNLILVVNGVFGLVHSAGRGI